MKKILPAIIAVVLALMSPAMAHGAGNGGKSAEGRSKAAAKQQQAKDNAKGGNAADAETEGMVNGKSPSTPDQDGVGMDRGIDNNDKTGPGTDGNNGCGNDPDREDDNNGWCGLKPDVSPRVGGNDEEEDEEAEDVADVEQVRGGARVLGVQFTREQPGALESGLATTGAAIAGLSAVGALALAFGGVARMAARKRR